mmetsp:Transcript_7705/g.11941  ORF Transcript_7705/g.11941 Transcript_7705/m.11941 type:complete len:151 (+) Transcript_7705:59-511(+)|eukprot:CAMPEP_0202711360 /NCGR_PEP_ID=MMETSP1385-20130828/23187_1 /ASSEMBLY_ACC=CAM_ASM_000861 /TAXON_ID=933848 /ORGANISM="Elphidium margaritaceum" /LENGTH=150 /DNA_ID=CAMNT_0049371087 /DNA_START=39 /DNA_END=491 /DNA_ORIENTATION=-
MVTLKLFAMIGALLICLCAMTNADETKYEDRGPCQYCKYCAFCDECRHCPCESRGPDDLPYCEYCPYCKYCSYCKLCDYCEEGGALSRLTRSIANVADSVINLFSSKDRDLAREAQKDFSKSGKDNDDKLTEEKLQEIENKYKDKMKPEL